MKPIVLILGPTGRMGRNAAIAFEKNGWDVRRFNRKTDTLWDAAWGASVIVNAWNPPYNDWAAQVPNMTRDIIEVAQASGATVIIPGNVYVYGPSAPEVLDHTTPHLAQNPLGKIRVRKEAAYRASGVQTIVVRAGDYIDTEPSGNWFDMIMAKSVSKGRFTSPGPTDCPRAYSYLPDVARTMVALANRREDLGAFEDVNAPSFTLTAQQFAAETETLLGRPVVAKEMMWWPIKALRPVWPLARGIVEMRYIWNMPHSLGETRQLDLCPEVQRTPLPTVLARALEHQIDPDQMMRASNLTIAE